VCSRAALSPRSLNRANIIDPFDIRHRMEQYWPKSRSRDDAAIRNREFRMKRRPGSPQQIDQIARSQAEQALVRTSGLNSREAAEFIGRSIAQIEKALTRKLLSGA